MTTVFRLLSFITVILQHEVTCGWFSSDERRESPIVLWWTPFTGESGNYRTCGEHTCFFTENRTYLSDPRTRVITFYGSSFSEVDLPLPRLPHHDWALLHEESPKNNPSFCHKSLLSLFNYTATWSRHSHFPLTLLSLAKLQDITEKAYYVSVAEKNRLQKEAGLAPVVYVQSSCDAPSERDAYVQELQKYINIDSYGKCLNNKALPEHLNEPAESMNDEDFYRLVAQYKFTIAFENAVGEDYVTEKFWRPLILGSVPIYLGSPSIRDWAPNNNSVIPVLDFASPEALTAYLHALNIDDEKYNNLLEHKTQAKISNERLVNVMKSRQWTVDHEDYYSQNFVEAFECYLCSEINHERLEEKAGYTSKRQNIPDTSHYDCPEPINPVTRTANRDNWWLEHWNHAGIEADVTHKLVVRNVNYTAEEFHNEVAQAISESMR